MFSELREQLQATLGTSYRLERELGGAGMSRVFVAHEHSLGRRIVVKILPPDMAASVSIERFRREIQLAAGLLHPHIIPLLSAGEADGLPYYTMPFVEGESLRLRLARDGAMDIDAGVRLAREVATALDYAHRQGVVHRDIKPENILLHDGHALITDFGIARAISRATDVSNLTVVGVAVGTPLYMSPEQGRADDNVDGRSDLYALGCVLYEMLVGSPPFPAATPHAIVTRHIDDPVPLPSLARPDVSMVVDDVVTRALAKRPGDRFASGAQFARALDHALACGCTVEPAPSTSKSWPITASLRSARPTVGAEPFVAVLPFENMSADPENEYFSDGITEEIIARLSMIRGLKVISRTSVMPYKKARRGVREIGRELGVSHLLEGSVRRAGQRVRIIAQLIDAVADEHVWAETYDREITDVFAIQSEVAERIAERMQARVTPGEHSRLARKPTEDVEAYHLYLLGRHHYNKVTPEDFAKALDHFRAAIRKDSSFARAYASLAEALQYQGGGYWGVRPRDTFPESLRLARKALELDPSSAEAHGALAVYYQWHDYDWDRSAPAFAQAVQLNPNAPMLRILNAMSLAALGRFDAALAEREAACRLDPGSMAIRGNASWITYLARQMDLAVAEARSLRLVEPASAYGAFSHGLVCAQAGHPEEAIGAFRDAVRFSDRASLYVVMLAYGLAVGGVPDEARTLLAEIDARTNEYVWPMGLGMAYAHLGDSDRALDYLERAYEDRVGWMSLIGREPAFDILRGNARFRRLAQRIVPPSAAAEIDG